MKGILQLISDEGTSEPFVARLWLGISQIRDNVLSHSLRKQEELDSARYDFDRAYNPVLDAMRAVRKSNKVIQGIVNSHRGKIDRREIIGYQRNAIEVKESIDEPLRDEIVKFLTNGVIAVKGVQLILKKYNLNIGFLFQKDTQFNSIIRGLMDRDKYLLADYLVNVRRKWLERFILMRNRIEHEGWFLPRVQYKPRDGTDLEFIEPQIDNINVTTYTKVHTNRILSFIENIIVYAFKSVLQDPVTIIEIPKNQRDPSNPIRFEWWIKGDPNKKEWCLIYDDHDFP